MLRTESLVAGYGGEPVLRGISIDVNANELVALIGRNGAGKTTLLMTLSGILRPAGGAAYFGERRIDKLAPHEIVKLGICQVPQGRDVFASLSVLENLEVAARATGVARKIDREAKLAEIYELFPALEERKQQAAGSLSGGQQQMVAVARALMATPQVLLLDEPSTGLAPLVVEGLMSTILQLRGRGLSILLVEQNAVMALEMADRAYVISEGAIQVEGPAAALKDSELVRAAYLGQLKPAP